jgi:uncharacterized membrane protein YagU involved in acid resistance
MSGISSTAMNDVPRSVVALAAIFFAIALALVTVVGLLAFPDNLLWYGSIIGILMAIWFAFVIYHVWATD